jgi:AcrR family transcriptional regulator
MDSKSKILNAALVMFTNEGFHGTSTAKITKAANISNGTLFHHFKTKEELINTLYLTEKELYKEYILDKLPVFSPTKKYMKIMWMMFLQHDLEYNDRVAFFALFYNSPYVDSLSKEQASRHFSFVLDSIQSLIENEVIIDVQPKLIVNSFYGSILAIYRFLLENDVDNEAEQKEIAFNMWWRSVINV